MSGVNEMDRLVLVSHALCPYVQRAAIALTEKGVPFVRRDVDLSAKPDWFLALSPLGKTPVLVACGQPVFESAVILQYLEETEANPLLPRDPLAGARERGWVEVSSAILNDIAGLYSAPDAAGFAAKVAALRGRFLQVEAALGEGPWFAGARFGLVDAAFGPVFRYFDSFDQIGDFGILTGFHRLARWRADLAKRPSVAGAVRADYPDRLMTFLQAREAHLSRLIAVGAVPA